MGQSTFFLYGKPPTTDVSRSPFLFSSHLLLEKWPNFLLSQTFEPLDELRRTWTSRCLERKSRLWCCSSIKIGRASVSRSVRAASSTPPALFTSTPTACWRCPPSSGSEGAAACCCWSSSLCWSPTKGSPGTLTAPWNACSFRWTTLSPGWPSNVKKVCCLNKNDQWNGATSQLSDVVLTYAGTFG